MQLLPTHMCKHACVNTHFDTGIGHAVSLVSLLVNGKKKAYLKVHHGLLYNLRAVRRYNLC